MIIYADENIEEAIIQGLRRRDIEFSKKKPQRAVEIGKGIAVHVTKKNELVALEIFDAKRRVLIESLFELQEVKP